MFESQPIDSKGTISYILDVHFINDNFLAVIMQASSETNDEFIQQLQDSGGLVCIDHNTEHPLPEMLYLCKAAHDSEREIKPYREKGDATTVASMCPVVNYTDVLKRVASNIKLQKGWDEQAWVTNQCKLGLQDFSIRIRAYAERDMRNNEAITHV
ncbi:hypothetical protein NVP1244A_061 [Vibrio phage 1.244.A._10N.261.54.C3]|nr:hypothetical protein NVP1244A_061 [Vibrio phage 1.244.A._10N.261.54.C3]AUR98689.1 hypothetical protein NVP1255O_061 [Vibrio phage 1.255.O._10N.286.45.F1]